MTRARDSDDQQCLDLLIVGAGLSGIGAAYRIIQRNPAADLSHRRPPGPDRGHVGSVPLSGHPLGQRHLHAELPVGAVAATRSRCARTPHPGVRRGRRTQTRHRLAHRLRHADSRRELGSRRRQMDGGGGARRGRSLLPLPVPLLRDRLLQLRRARTPPNSQDSRIFTVRSSIPSSGRRIWTIRANGSSSSAAVPPRSA